MRGRQGEAGTGRAAPARASARQTKFLLTVAEERSADRAAARLGVPMAELVEELRRLEQRLGGQVLERTTVGLRLTAIGRAHLTRALDETRRSAAPVAPVPGRRRRAPAVPVVDPFPPEARRPLPAESAPPTRRAVLAGAGALGVAAVGAAVVGWRTHGARPTLGGEGGAPQEVARLRAQAPKSGPTAAEVAADLIRAENARPGSPGWVLALDDHTPRAIEGFSSVASASHGEPVTLFVRSRTDTFHVEAYRLGWYGGVKARLVWTSAELPGGRQDAPTIDPDTNMVDCSHWDASTTFTPDESWVHGQYLLKLVQPDQKASYIPFVLKSPAPFSEVLVVAGVTTGAAYETWGGHSLYGGLDGGVKARADVVSLDRPFGEGYGGAGWLLGGSSEIAQLLESQGVDVSYTTNVDQHADPTGMTRTNLIVSSSHDEYYSMEMRLGLQGAANAGVNIIFLGANAVYRKIRFEESPVGAHRRIVNYRSAQTDPETRDELVTTNWREGPAPLPESTLTANWYESNQPGLTADIKVVDASAWMWTDTGVTTGSAIADGVREEWDRVRPGKPLPDELQILGHSPLTVRGKPSVSDMTYATFPSGAAVFNSGTLRFQQRLGPLSPPGQGGDDGALRRLVWNLVDAMRTGPAGTRHPAVPNVDHIYPDGDTAVDVGSDPSA